MTTSNATPSETTLTQAQQADLLSKGFVRVAYEDQEGAFFRRDTIVGTMPYAGEHLIDTEVVNDTDIATTEVTPAGYIQMLVNGTDLPHEEYLFDSDEGRALLQDAVAGTAEPRLIRPENGVNRLA